MAQRSRILQAAAALYFVSFFVLITYVMINILTATMIDAFENIAGEHKKERGDCRAEAGGPGERGGGRGRGRGSYYGSAPASGEARQQAGAPEQADAGRDATGFTAAEKRVLRRIWARHYGADRAAGSEFGLLAAELGGADGEGGASGVDPFGQRLSKEMLREVRGAVSSLERAIAARKQEGRESEAGAGGSGARQQAGARRRGPSSGL
jgi:hypothetical protein